MKNILSLTLTLSFFVACNNTQDNNTSHLEKEQPDSVVTATNDLPAEKEEEAATTGTKIPTLGQFDLSSMTKETPHEYGGGDCYGHATKYTSAERILVTDSVSCGEYGSTYTHYLLDANEKLLAIYIHAPKLQFSDGAEQPSFVVREQVIDFRTTPITTAERSASFANAAEATPNTAAFNNGPLTETATDYPYWKKAYQELWTATVEED